MYIVDSQSQSQSRSQSSSYVGGGLSMATFTIKNVSEISVLFRIQTTSPINFRVKPSHGRVEPGEIKEAHSKKIIMFYYKMKMKMKMILILILIFYYNYYIY